MAAWKDQFDAGYKLGQASKVLAKAGLVDQSWRNDSCPSFLGRGVVVWAEYPNRSMRDWHDCKRYTVVVADGDGCATADVLLETERLKDVLALLGAGDS